jgi:hypothetical protein
MGWGATVSSILTYMSVQQELVDGGKRVQLVLWCGIGARCVNEARVVQRAPPTASSAVLSRLGRMPTPIALKRATSVAVKTR